VQAPRGRTGDGDGVVTVGRDAAEGDAQRDEAWCKRSHDCWAKEELHGRQPSRVVVVVVVVIGR